MIIVTGGDAGLGREIWKLTSESLRGSVVTVDEASVQVVADVRTALTSLGKHPRLEHVIVDLRPRESLDRAEDREFLEELTKAAAKRSATVSILFDRLRFGTGTDRLGDLRFVFGNSVVDQVVEIRSENDLHDALNTIVSHVSARVITSPEALEVLGAADVNPPFAVGSLFTVDNGDYSQARTRSLISNRMGGFVADLRAAYGRMAQWELRKELPWDAHDGAPARSSKTAKGWQLDSKTTSTPNLQDLLNAYSESESKERLAGLLPADESWFNKWKQHPPLLLLTGESGTGKSLVARTIAELLTPPGQAVRFEQINGAGLTESSWDHRMHGSGPGAWTGIDEAVVGQLARGAHGVVFIDEIGDLPLSVQAALLTFLDDRLIRPTRMQPFRGFQHIIAATNRDVDEGASQRWFRNDLLARFALRLEIPPLRERSVDDPEKSELRQLIDFVLQDPTVNPRVDGVYSVTHVSHEAMTKLVDFDYRDGNFRELSEAVHTAIRSAQRRYSRLVDVGDITLAHESRFRSDRDSHRIRVLRVEVPEGAPRALVETEADLRLLAWRERRTFVTDQDDNSWVLPATTAFTTDGDAYDEVDQTSTPG
jgi:transcriptional regulator with AAA-type ATPase domain